MAALGLPVQGLAGPGLSSAASARAKGNGSLVPPRGGAMVRSEPARARPTRRRCQPGAAGGLSGFCEGPFVSIMLVCQMLRRLPRPPVV